MKTFKRILCLVLATLTFSAVFASCGKTSEQSDSGSGSSSGSNSGNNSASDSGYFDEPEEPIELTNFTLVNNGQSDYKIVLADKTFGKRRTYRVFLRRNGY